MRPAFFRLPPSAPLLAPIIVWAALVPAFAAGSQAAGVAPAGGTDVVTITLAGLLSLGSGVLTHFVTRREWSAKVDEIERRLANQEAGTPTRHEFDQARERIASLDTIQRNDVSQIYGRINSIDRAVGAIETETAHQSKTLAEILRRLPGPPLPK